MRLYFLRHAHAENFAASDHDRRLTAEGIQAAHNTADTLKKLDILPVKIFSSPRVRALETAKIVGDTLGIEVEVNEAVNFGFDVDAVDALIQKTDRQSDLMFVGHEPTMSNTIQSISGAQIQMKKSGLARIDILTYAPLRGDLIWLVAPSVFGALNRK